MINEYSGPLLSFPLKKPAFSRSFQRRPPWCYRNHMTKARSSKSHLGKTDAGADPGFFLGGGALVSCSTSTPINHIASSFFCRIPVVLENHRSTREGGVVRTPCTLPLDPPLRCIVFFVWIPVVSRCYLNKYAIINGVFHNFEIENSHHWWTKLEGLSIKCVLTSAASGSKTQPS